MKVKSSIETQNEQELFRIQGGLHHLQPTGLYVKFKDFAERIYECNRVIARFYLPTSF